MPTSVEQRSKTIYTDTNLNNYFQISEEEISFLTKGEDPYDDAVVRKLFHPNLKLLLVTEGPDGCRYYTKVSLIKMLASTLLLNSPAQTCLVNTL